MTRRPNFPPKRKPVLLESLCVADLIKWKKNYSKLRDFHTSFYEETASQRARLKEEISNSLRPVGRSFNFENWNRIVSFQYSLVPLSTLGSFLNDPGGRFNIGDIDPTRFPRFSALYAAEDLDTALRETFGVKSESGPDGGFTSEELALVKPEQFTRIVVSGELRQVCDLTDMSKLKNYLNVVKRVSLSKPLRVLAIKYKMRLVATLADLRGSLLHDNWRSLPQILDVPSTSQIFAMQLVYSGFDGLVYPSAKNGKLCIAVFPKNFENSTARVWIGSDCPPEVTQRDITSSNWKDYWHSGI